MNDINSERFEGSEIDLKLLTAFDEIYRQRSISRAADSLDLFQPTLSNQLARLRRIIGDPLFVRKGNGVRPTPRAEELVTPVQEALAALRRSISQDQMFDPATSSQIFRLIVADPLETIVGAHLIRQAGAAVAMHFLPPQHLHIEHALLAGEIDLSVFLLPQRHREIISEPLTPVDVVLIARKDHPRVKSTNVSEALQTERLVSLAMTPGALANSEKLSAWRHVGRADACLVSKVSSIIRFVATTECIGMAPRLYAENVADQYGLAVYDLPRQISDQQFFMSWRSVNDQDPANKWLRDKVLEAVDDQIIS